VVVSDGRAARRAVLAHVLRVLSTSAWAEYLVLRGSVTLRAWLGEFAREPGDIDFVVLRCGVGADGLPAGAIGPGALLDGVLAALAENPGPGLRADEADVDEIDGYYNYGDEDYYDYRFDPADAADFWPAPMPRRPGSRLPEPLPYGFQEERPDPAAEASRQLPVTRLRIPYDVDHQQGFVRIDLSFDERLAEAPVVIEIPPAGARMLAATPTLSLAWKIYWLLNDVPARGKDLYDAVLLAERMPVSLAHLCTLLAELEGWTELSMIGPLAADQVAWDRFRAEHPHVDGDARSWLDRLGTALAAG